MNYTCTANRQSIYPSLLVACTCPTSHPGPHQGSLGPYLFLWDERNYLSIADIRTREIS